MRGADMVFISYSHDSRKHSNRVLELANKLREMGVDAELDQYHTRPAQGWAQWSDEQLEPEKSKFVLLICTENFRRRVENKVPADEGRGVYWEGGAIYSYIYKDKTNERFIPVLLGDESDESVPIRMQRYQTFRIAEFDLSDVGFEALYRELTGQPAVIKPPLGEKVALAAKPLSAPVIHAPLPERPALTRFPDPTRRGIILLLAGFVGPVAFLGAMGTFAIVMFRPGSKPTVTGELSPDLHFQFDQARGLYCEKANVRDQFITFFDVITISLSACEGTQDSGSRSYRIVYSPEGPHSSPGLGETRRNYALCFESDFIDRAPKIISGVEKFFYAQRSAIPCRVNVEVSRIIYVTYNDIHNRPNLSVFQQTYNRSGSGGWTFEQLNSATVARSDQMEVLNLTPNFGLEKGEAFKAVKTFAILGIPRI